MGREATLYLTERGVRVTGIDGWSWDAPFSFTAKRYAKDHDPKIIWEGHKAGRDIGYCHLEKLHNLEALPPSGFMVVVLPGEGERRLRRLDTGGRDPRQLSSKSSGRTT